MIGCERANERSETGAAEADKCNTRRGLACGRRLPGFYLI